MCMKSQYQFSSHIEYKISTHFDCHWQHQHLWEVSLSPPGGAPSTLPNTFHLSLEWLASHEGSATTTHSFIPRWLAQVLGIQQWKSSGGFCNPVKCFSKSNRTTYKTPEWSDWLCLLLYTWVCNTSLLEVVFSPKLIYPETYMKYFSYFIYHIPYSWKWG